MFWLLLFLFGVHVDITDATPGALCSITDPDFDEYRYAERIPHCARNITAATKKIVAARYKVARQDYKYYEFDHLIPLALGGSNNPENIWPQLLSEAKQKDELEVHLYYQLKSGTITQVQAVQAIRDWRAANGVTKRHD